MRALLLYLFTRSAWAQADTVEAGRAGACAALASVQSFGLGAESQCGGGHDM
jgi:hypothetical protein